MLDLDVALDRRKHIEGPVERRGVHDADHSAIARQVDPRLGVRVGDTDLAQLHRHALAQAVALELVLAEEPAAMEEGRAGLFQDAIGFLALVHDPRELPARIAGGGDHEQHRDAHEVDRALLLVADREHANLERRG